MGGAPQRAALTQVIRYRRPGTVVTWCGEFEGVFDSRHPGPGAREGGSDGKICDRFSDDYCYRPYPFVSRGTEGTDR